MKKLQTHRRRYGRRHSDPKYDIPPPDMKETPASRSPPIPPARPAQRGRVFVSVGEGLRVPLGPEGGLGAQISQPPSQHVLPIGCLKGVRPALHIFQHSSGVAANSRP